MHIDSVILFFFRDSLRVPSTYPTVPVPLRKRLRLNEISRPVAEARNFPTLWQRASVET